MFGSKIKVLLGTTVFMAGLATLAYLTLAMFPAQVLAQQGGGIDPEVMRWGFMAAALCTGLACVAAAFAVASVGAAAVGAVAEKPEVFGRALVFLGLAEGIAIYGLIVSIMILNLLV